MPILWELGMDSHYWLSRPVAVCVVQAQPRCWQVRRSRALILWMNSDVETWNRRSLFISISLPRCSIRSQLTCDLTPFIHLFPICSDICELSSLNHAFIDGIDLTAVVPIQHWDVDNAANSVASNPEFSSISQVCNHEISHSGEHTSMEGGLGLEISSANGNQILSTWSHAFSSHGLKLWSCIPVPLCSALRGFLLHSSRISLLMFCPNMICS